METFRFLQWQWQQWTGSDKLYFLALGLLAIGLAVDYTWVWRTGALIIFAMIFKWAVVDSTVKSYNEYKRQRDGLFDEIKGN